jgi:hypothetical protein
MIACFESFASFPYFLEIAPSIAANAEKAKQLEQVIPEIQSINSSLRKQTS